MMPSNGCLRVDPATIDAEAAELVVARGMILESAVWSMADVPALLASATLHQNVRVLIEPGAKVTLLPSTHTAVVAQVLDNVRQPGSVAAGDSAGIVLDREVDVSRGDWIVATTDKAVSDDEFDTEATSGPAWPGQRELLATVAGMDDEPLVPGRVYLAQHGHRWIKAKVRRVVNRLDINTLAEEAADKLEANAIGTIELTLQESTPAAPFLQTRVLGSMILVDTASHKTAGAVLVRS